MYTLEVRLSFHDEIGECIFEKQQFRIGMCDGTIAHHYKQHLYKFEWLKAGPVLVDDSKPLGFRRPTDIAEIRSIATGKRSAAESILTQYLPEDYAHRENV